MLNKPYKMARNFLPNWRNFTKSGHTVYQCLVEVWIREREHGSVDICLNVGKCFLPGAILKGLT